VYLQEQLHEHTVYKICFQHEIYGQLCRLFVGLSSSENTERNCNSH